MIQTAGWAFALLAVLLLLTSVMVAISRHKSTGKKMETRLEEASSEVQTPAPTIETPSTRHVDLHPMVAQLKAELAGTHMPIESVPVPQLEEPPAPTGQPPATANPPTPPLPTPTTVVIGVVPVQKKADKQTPAEEKPQPEEKPKGTDEAKSPPNT